jgi:K+-sensing histidine kinase KdpD
MTLRHMLVNLVSNADRYRGDNITEVVFQDEDEAVVQVIDDGPGIPDETLPMLFGRYLHSRGGALVRGSLGLGTAVVNAHAEALAGSIE